MNPLAVVCVKWGDKYPSYYVNRLCNMTARHLARPHDFVCFTDNTVGIQPGIITRPLGPQPLEGWWWKTYLFQPGLFAPKTTLLFFDLDMVIVGSIDKLIDHEPGRFMGLRDLIRAFHPERRSLGSAVLRWQADEHSNIWQDLLADPSVTNRHRGDQDWIWHLHQHHMLLYPDPWIRSYTWEVRRRSELINKREHTQFREVKNPDLEPETCVLAFHGFPRLEAVQDPVIVSNWQ